MGIRAQKLFLMLILTAMVLAGCVENSVHSDGGTAGPAEVTPPAAEEPDIPEESTSKTETNPLDAQYMQGEFWKLTEDSSDLLPLDTDETPAAYFGQLQSQATAEAERYIQEICLPTLENFQAEYGGTKTGDTFYEETRIDNLGLV